MKCTINIPYETNLIECKNKSCGMKFILFGVFIPHKKHGDGIENSIMPQVKAYYCPYCGEKQE